MTKVSCLVPLVIPPVASLLRRFVRVALLPLLAFAASLFPLAVHAQTSAVPGLISYQGRVSDATGAFVGASAPVNRTVIFRIWNHASNATAAELVYSEQQTVTISNGEFSVLIGQGTAVTNETAKGPPSLTIGAAGVFSGAVRYLGVTVDDGTSAVDTEISPRQQMVSSAYALRSKYAEFVGANGANALTALDNGNIGIGNTAPTQRLHVTGNSLTTGTAYLLDTNHSIRAVSGSGLALSTFGVTDGLFLAQTSGNVGVGTTAPDAKLEVVGNAIFTGNVGVGSANVPTSRLDVNGAITVFDGGSKSFPGGLVSEAGATMINFGMNNSRFGTQTNASQGGFLRVNTQSVSNLFQFYGRAAAGTSSAEIMSITAAGNVGIGEVSPATKLEVAGGIRADGATGYTFNGVGDTDGGLFSPGDGVITVRSNAAERLRIDSAGNVGIGDTAPTTRLEVAGGVRATSGFSLNRSGATAGGMYAPSDDNLVFRTGSTDRLRIDEVGNVGIGAITQPKAKLDVDGGVYVNGLLAVTDGGSRSRNAGIQSEVNGQLINFGVNDSSSNRFGGTYTSADQGGFFRVDSRAGSLFSFHARAASATSTSEVVTITSSGYVGIGTNTPQWPLDVRGSIARSFVLEGVLGNTGASDIAAQTRTDLAHSANFEGRVRSASFDVVSDVRIKSVQGRSVGVNDLALLQQLEITDYSFRDPITFGKQPQKKLIAQQVERVFPQAVNQTKGVVPDIFKSAEIADGWVQLATDLRRGERVRLVAGGREAIEEVLEVEPNRFLTAFRTESAKVVVYGREVKDFRAIDYEAIAMLNVSATQELARQVEALQTSEARNVELARRVAELEAKDRARDAKLAAIEKLLSASSTVMAQPAKPATANGQE